MDGWSLASGLLGGLGLFLLGMGLLTEGLKLAAGSSLARILRRATAGPGRALASGVLITALVQSSSAVTLATIGFVNAGLMPLGAALWVLFGANVGTSMTGWLVALIGLKVQIETLALALLGVGSLLRLSAGRGPRIGLGHALAGLGLLFLGIDVLRDGLSDLAGRLPLPDGDRPSEVLALTLLGIALTVLMQSSSASIALTLTAAQEGLLGTLGAAAVVIGANIGTTTTAILGAIGATPDAKRAAAAHVLFNVITALVALILLPWLVALLEQLRIVLGLGEVTAAKLALFHTLFNLLGVALVAPFADRLARFLERRFASPAERLGRPRHLDHTLLGVPELALAALRRELERAWAIAAEAWEQRLAGEPAEDTIATGERLLGAIQRFVAGLHRSAMSVGEGARLARLLRVHRYLDGTLDLAREDAEGLGLAIGAGAQSATGATIDALLEAARSRLKGRERPIAGGRRTASDADGFEAAYQAHKAATLAAAARGELELESMDRILSATSRLRRSLRHLDKAADLLAEETGAGSREPAGAAVAH